MHPTRTLLAALTLLLAVTLTAEAEELGTWHRQAPAAATEAAGGSPEIVTGNNFFHAMNCVTFIDGTAATVCVLSTPAENIVACTTIPAVQTGMLTACQTGNFVDIHVPNAATGAFTQFITFTHK